jgi:hypothetical protein
MSSCARGRRNVTTVQEYVGPGRARHQQYKEHHHYFHGKPSIIIHDAVTRVDFPSRASRSRLFGRDKLGPTVLREHKARDTQDTILLLARLAGVGA